MLWSPHVLPDRDPCESLNSTFGLDNSLYSWYAACSMDDPIKAYYDHLDICPQCEREPFNQCPIGAVLLNVAGTAAMQELLKGVPLGPRFERPGDHKEG